MNTERTAYVAPYGTLGSIVRDWPRPRPEESPGTGSNEEREMVADGSHPLLQPGQEAERLVFAERYRAIFDGGPIIELEPLSRGDPHLCDPPTDQEIMRRFNSPDATGERDDGAAAVDINDLLFTDPSEAELPCLINGWVGSGHFIPLSGGGGAHKSRLLLQTSLGLLFGLDWFGPASGRGTSGMSGDWWPTRAGIEVARVEYLSYENDPAEDHRRIVGMKRAIGIKERSAVPMTLWPLRSTRTPLLIVDEKGMVLTAFGIKMLRHWWQTSEDGGHMVIVLDSLFNAIDFKGKSKVDDDVVKHVIYLLDHWCRLLNATILAPFHPSRAGATRGDLGYSPNFENTPRQCLAIEALMLGAKYGKAGKPSGTYQLAIKKWNGGQQGPTVDFRCDDGATLRTAEEPGNQGHELPSRVALDIVLGHTYGRDAAIIKKLCRGDLDDKERATIERQFDDRIKRNGGYGLARNQAKLSASHPMIGDFRLRTGNTKARVPDFLAACGQAAAQGWLVYQEATPNVSSGYRFPTGYRLAPGAVIEDEPGEAEAW